ncbi:hypothetical protein QJS10_CPA05g01792 [Acorus calamus]|uniref:Uncharacterized protein n=1 Tax=Acorus calamus TaxID=4465 RepID=A0AAV9ES72_ACOCL|nr:hypothetical protein QJS10_CPA05g01792 [Acorus calamus]
MFQGSSDESHWLHLNKSLNRVSSMMNGKAKAIQEIEVDRVYCLDHASSPHQCTITGETTDDLKFGKSVDENTQVSEMLGETLEVHQLSQNKNAEFCMSSMQLDSLNCEDLSNSSLCMQEESFLCVNTDDGDSEAMVAGDSCLLISQVISVNCKVQAEQTQIALSQKHDGSDTNTTSCLRAEWLRFEVSQNTGRVHLYACVPDLDSRPRPLSENFRPEELESLLSNAAGAHEDLTSKLMKENPTFWNACRTFLKEWNDLRPIERNKLLGKPLQLPLNVELFFLEEMANYGRNGLLRGGSKRRVTPLDEISHPLPEDAVWKNVYLHSGSKREKMYTQGWTLNEEPLCLLCQRPCNGKLAKEPEYFEDLFCGMDCFEHYRIRSSQKSLRGALFQIEHGVCTECKLDCHKLVRCIKHLSIARRKDYVEKVAPKIASRKNCSKGSLSNQLRGMHGMLII